MACGIGWTKRFLCKDNHFFLFGNPYALLLSYQLVPSVAERGINRAPWPAWGGFQVARPGHFPRTTTFLPSLFVLVLY